MAEALPSLDWSLVQTFLAVAEYGSLSAAARVLGRSQPTLGRHVKLMEDQLGSELFRRHEKGLSLTRAGEALLGTARSMRSAAHELQLEAQGRTARIQGTVRISASVVVATHHLPGIIATIRVREPSISIELVPSDETSKLHFREADIALRMYRPTQLDLVTQHIGDISFSAFASRSYLKRRGLPQDASELLSHDVVGFDRETAILEGFRLAGFPVDREWFQVRCDDHAAHWALVKAGCGIGFAQTSIGRSDPDLVELPLDFGIPKLPLWLTAHDVVRQAPRVARIWEILARELKSICDKST